MVSVDVTEFDVLLVGMFVPLLYNVNVIVIKVN